MREILFRGKTKQGEWFEGSLLQYKVETPKKTEKHYKIQEFNYGYNDENEIDCAYMSGFDEEVIPETVGQFTGLNDKNGKKIFEGDIVQGTIVSAWNKALIRCEVVYNKDGFISVERTRNQDWVHKVKFAKDIEVIGNIHDNPELLEQVK